MARLIKGNLDEEFTIGGFGRQKRVVLKKQVSDTGETLGYELRNAADDSIVASHAQLMESFTNFANNMLGYGQNRKVSLELLKRRDIVGDLFDSSIPRETIVNPRTASDFAQISQTIDKDLAFLRTIIGKDGGITVDDYQNIAKARSRLIKYESITDFSAQSRMYDASQSMATVSDEAGFETVRYLMMRNAFKTGANTTKTASSVLDDLLSKGVISKSQHAEAQLATLSTRLNIDAFKTYMYDPSGLENVLTSTGSNSAGNLINTLERFKATRTSLSDSPLLDPVITGQIESAGMGRLNPLRAVKPTFKKNFGMGKYQGSQNATAFSGLSKDARGNAFTFAPTFGTALNQNAKATIMSATGVHTYGNQEGFSLTSVPMSVGFQRLNRYFGTVGSGLKESNFYGPLDLYFRGMVGERVLPATIVGATALTADRTIGGYTQEKDQRGERVYSPLFIGAAARVGVEAQAAVSGLTPGGMGYGQKREQLLHGEVPIRKGRFWPLGNTPFKGGKIEYYRPSWYRRLQGGAMYTSDTYGSPMEKFLYYNDFSPLRPIDPYRFEKKHYKDRPYPVTGEYFSGPYGAAVPILNSTIGRILKPQKVMHKEELDRGLASYQPVGESGAYIPTTDAIKVDPRTPYNTDPAIRLVYPDYTFSAAPVIGRDPKPLNHISPNLNISNYIGGGKLRFS